MPRRGRADPFQGQRHTEWEDALRRGLADVTEKHLQRLAPWSDDRENQGGLGSHQHRMRHSSRHARNASRPNRSLHAVYVDPDLPGDDVKRFVRVTSAQMPVWVLFGDPIGILIPDIPRLSEVFTLKVRLMRPIPFISGLFVRSCPCQNMSRVAGPSRTSNQTWTCISEKFTLMRTALKKTRTIIIFETRSLCTDVWSLVSRYLQFRSQRFASPP